MPRKCIRAAALGVLLAMTGVWCAAAEIPYRPYDKTEWKTALAAPAAFEPVGSVNGDEAGSGPLESPQDMAFDREGRLYVADTGNNRIVLLDESLTFVRAIDQLQNDKGETETMREPTSVFAAEDGSLYVVDTGNERALKIDGQGRILQEFLRPQDEMFTSQIFEPIKIQADTKGMVYILARNVFQGILVYNQQGRFEGYFGAPRVNVTAKLLLDRFWKGLLSSSQLETMRRYVPVEYAGFSIDEEGFVYAVQPYSDTNQEQIRKLNYLGNNILPFTGNFGEKDTLDYKRERWYTKFTDIDVEDGFLYALDTQWQRVYWFDRDGNRLGVFGTQGEQLGSFRAGAAVKVRDGRVYVLDRLKNNLTIFARTTYGDRIFEAVRLYGDGDYTEAVEPWRQALSMDANNEMAYCGIGEALLKAKEYDQAVTYFRLGYSRERESVAFGYARSEALRANIGWVLIGLLLIVAALVLFTNKRFLGRLRRNKPPSASRWAVLGRRIGAVLVRPVESYNELKFVRYRNVPLTAAILAVWLLVTVISRLFTGFRFQTGNADEFSLLIQCSVTVLPFLLFCVANWAVCGIMGGEGRFGEITTYMAIALIPSIVFTAATTALSRVVLLEEGAVLQVVSAVGLLWSALLVFQGQRIVHNYSGGKTIGAVVLSAFGVLVILILLLLLFALGQQVVAFVRTIYAELLFRK